MKQFSMLYIIVIMIGLLSFFPSEVLAHKVLINSLFEWWKKILYLHITHLLRSQIKLNLGSLQLGGPFRRPVMILSLGRKNKSTYKKQLIPMKKKKKTKKRLIL